MRTIQSTRARKALLRVATYGTPPRERATRIGMWGFGRQRLAQRLEGLLEGSMPRVWAMAVTKETVDDIIRQMSFNRCKVNDCIVFYLITVQMTTIGIT